MLRVCGFGVVNDQVMNREHTAGIGYGAAPSNEIAELTPDAR